LGVLAQQRIVAFRVPLGQGTELGVAGVSERDEGVTPEVARVFAREIEAFVSRAHLVVRELEPLDERDVRLGALGGLPAGPPLLYAPIPRADVLTDVAA
jgi:hypothetical protein